MTDPIHPTAVIHEGAAIGPDCRIGAYCVIGPNVRLEAGCRLHDHAVIDGCTVVGECCEVFPFACIGKSAQDLKYSGGTAFVEIGADTTLREYVTVNAGTEEGSKTVVGEHCHILAYCHVAHDCRLGRGVVMSNCVQLAGHVTVGDYTVFGGLAGVHQFVRVGRMAMVSATAKVVQDVLPYCLVNGSPALPHGLNKIGLQRRGLSSETIDAIGQAYRTIFRANLTMDKAVEVLQASAAIHPEVAHMLEFVAESGRGLARPRKNSKRNGATA